MGENIIFMLPWVTVDIFLYLFFFIKGQCPSFYLYKGPHSMESYFHTEVVS